MAILEVTGRAEFMGVVKSQPSGEQIGPTADMRTIKEELNAQFKSLATTLQTSPLTNKTLTRIEQDIASIKAALAAKNPDVNVVERSSSDIVVAMTRDSSMNDQFLRMRLKTLSHQIKNASLTPESLSEIEAIMVLVKKSQGRPLSDIPEIEAKLDMVDEVLRLEDSTQRDMIYQETSKAVSKMSHCLASGLAMTPQGACVKANPRVRCTYILANGEQCRHFVGPLGDRTREVCYSHK
jgi:hypothetical protein